MSCLLSLGILCALSLALSLASSLALSLVLSLTLSLVTFSYLLGCDKSAHSSLYIIGLDKQSYVELITNQYRCFVGFLWRYNVYLAFHPLWPIHITHCPSISLSTISFTLARPSYVIHITSLTLASCFPQTL